MNHEERLVAKLAVQRFRAEKARSHITQESHKKRAESLKGHTVSEETKEKIRQRALGRKHSEETKEKIRLARQNQVMTPKMLAALAANRGENSLLWKGPNVGYRALHRWVEKKLGKPDKCERCPREGLSGHAIHWANKSGEYQRELSDWMRLCALCHKQNDKGLINN